MTSPDEIQALAAEIARRMRVPALLTIAGFAREVGLDRHLVTELVNGKMIRTVPVPGAKGFRIPRTEIERVMAEGLVERATRRREPTPRRSKDYDPEAAILALEV